MTENVERLDDVECTVDGFQELADDAIEKILQAVGHAHVPACLDRIELKADIDADVDFHRGYDRIDSKGQRTERRKYAEKISAAAKALARLLDDFPIPKKLDRLLSEKSLLDTEALQIQSRINKLKGDKSNARVRAQHQLDCIKAKLKELECMDKKYMRSRSNTDQVRRSANQMLGPAFRQQLTVAENITKIFDGSTSMRAELGLAPTDQLLGRDLPPIFEKHFAPLRACRTREHGGEGEPRGPYIRFARAVGKLFLGEEWSNETVSAAMTKACSAGKI
jgi:hypothetical protein